MAHFAKISSTGLVEAVYVVDNAKILDPETGTESEQRGREFLSRILGGQLVDFVQTSYNGNFRGKYAGIGDRYDAEADLFLTP